MVRIGVMTALLSVVLLMLGEPAAADGKMFRHFEAVDDPTIVTQRALVVFREGMQTWLLNQQPNTPVTRRGGLCPYRRSRCQSQRRRPRGSTCSHECVNRWLWTTGMGGRH